MIFSEFFGYSQPIKKSGHVTVGKNYVSIPRPSKITYTRGKKVGHVTVGKWLHNHHISIFPDPIKSHMTVGNYYIIIFLNHNDRSHDLSHTPCHPCHLTVGRIKSQNSGTAAGWIAGWVSFEYYSTYHDNFWYEKSPLITLYSVKSSDL